MFNVFYGIDAAQAPPEHGMGITDDFVTIGRDGLCTSLITTPLIATDQQLLTDEGKKVHKFMAAG